MNSGFAEGFAVGQGNNNGWGNGGELLWIIVLFALLGGGWGGNGWNNNGGSQMGYDLGKVATTNDVASGFTNSAIMGNQREITLTLSNLQNYINQGFSGLNVQLLTGFNNVERQISDCCCRTQTGIEGINFNIERSTCAIKEAINNQGDRVINWLTNEKIETQRDTINQLRNKIAWLENGGNCCGCGYGNGGF